MSEEVSCNLEQEIIKSWATNANPWINAIKTNAIESRVVITNQAILDTVLSDRPEKILDVGCGEGWLVKELTDRDANVFGIDASPALVQHAKTISHASFGVCTYEELSRYPFPHKFDCIVCNFSLIGKQSAESVIEACANLLEPEGRLIIQTLHPVINSLDKPYQDGWRAGSWDGFSADFTNPAPWYFRTIESWCHLLSDHEFQIRIKEPVHPDTCKPLSIIFDCKKNSHL